MNRICGAWIFIISAMLMAGCSAKTLECAPNTILLTIECGDQAFSGGDIEVARAADGRVFAKSVVFTCPGDAYVLRLNVADYKAGDKYSVLFTPAGGAAAITSQIDAPAGCTPWKLKMDASDGGVANPGDGGGGAGGTGGGGAGGTAPAGSIETGATCKASVECQSGFCADGVCCESECLGSCSACNLPASPGLCRPLAKGDKPSQPKSCETSPESTCGLDGSCDGEGACAKYPDGTLCEKGACDVGGTTGRKVCQGGACSGSLELPCAPYLCDPATVTCFAKCTANDQCVPGKTCDAEQSCGKKQLGASCESNSECLSDKCVDKFCCNTACNGACEACNLPGKVGECSAVAKGVVDPHAVCKQEDISTCKNTGTCDGNRGCAVYEANAVCKAATCSGNTFTASSKCDGAGACVAGSTNACAPFACGAAACVQTCTGDAECVGGNLCINGSCGKKDEGAVCGGDGECKSAFCRDNVCCESACSGNCRSCNAAGKAGKCTLTAAGVKDPRNGCTDAGAASCKNDGKCDGAGGCRNYPSGTECIAQSCNAGTNTGSFRHECNGTGTCTKTQDPVSCAPGRCGGTACTLQCSVSDDCVAPNTCVNNLCGKKPNGQLCNNPPECQSGNCIDGVCCESACTGACKTCNAPGNAGKCVIAGAGQDDPHGVCVASGTACGTTGFCGSGGTCAFQTNSTTCGAASCNAGAGLFTPASLCNGSGTCVAQTQMMCPQRLACNASGCLQACSGDGQCASGAYCNNGQCLPKGAGGTACTSGVQCANGICSPEGICCNASCDGVCKSCATGTCSEMTGDDPGMCSGTKTCSNGCKSKDLQPCTVGTDCVSGVCTTFYPDMDDDKYGSNVGAKFCGGAPPPSYLRDPGDCCDKDKDAHPHVTEPVYGITNCLNGDFNCDNKTDKFILDIDKSVPDFYPAVVIPDNACATDPNTGSCKSLTGFFDYAIPDSQCGEPVRKMTCGGPPNACYYFNAWGGDANNPKMYCL